ncbi:uncharacterized protein LOC141573117 [Rhinolophus sinicus]|uniref:uncharacterized protein LOC141573117 n=1 Tax=Rhinolophus sinicus TaxID=89399 RepID=UPI003D7B50B2
MARAIYEIHNKNSNAMFQIKLLYERDTLQATQRARPGRTTEKLLQNNKEERQPQQESQSEFHLILRQAEKGVRGRRTDPGTPGTRGTAAGPSCLRAAGPARPIRRPRSLSRRIAGLPRAPCRRRREPAPGRGSRGRGARARPGEGEGTGRVTWSRAMARRVRSPAGASPRGRRARRSPGGPERSSAPASKRPGQAAPPRGRAAARAGRAASSSRAAPRRGASLAGRPAPLTRSPTPGGHGAEGREERGSRERADANASSATRAAPLPQRRRRPGPRFCCQLVERTLSMRARRPHPGCFEQKIAIRMKEVDQCHERRVRALILLSPTSIM